MIGSERDTIELLFNQYINAERFINDNVPEQERDDYVAEAIIQHLDKSRSSLYVKKYSLEGDITPKYKSVLRWVNSLFKKKQLSMQS